MEVRIYLKILLKVKNDILFVRKNYYLHYNTHCTVISKFTCKLSLKIRQHKTKFATGCHKIVYVCVFTTLQTAISTFIYSNKY